MSYVALYRKFRPRTFDEVKGQNQITTILKNQIKGKRIGHAYLFSGTRGTGKTSVAKIFAKAVNCESPVEGSPCGNCEICKRIAEGANLNVVEIDAASSNGVDNIREIIEEVRYSPTEGNYKVYIIDEVHMLSIGAFNALLKTLEEPPSYVIFILATTEIHKIPITILSRCQRYDFKRISMETIAGRLKELLEIEGAEYEEEALDFIARKGDGSMRDALSLLDQCLSFYFGEKLTYEHALEVLGAVDVDIFLKLFYAIQTGDVVSCLDLVEEVAVSGVDIGQFVNDFTWFMRNLLLLKVSEDSGNRIDVSRDKIAKMFEITALVEEEDIIRYIQIFSKLSADMKYSNKKRAVLEIALIKLCKPEMEANTEALLARIRKLEKRLEEGDFSVRAEGEGSGERREERPFTEPEKKSQNMQRKALPEEMKKVAKEFYSIINETNIRQPLRSNLKLVKPYYEEEGECLILAVEDETLLRMLEKEENILLLKKNIHSVIGADCNIKIKLETEAKKGGAVQILGLENIAAGLVEYED